MTLGELLHALGDRGIELWAEGDRLRFRSPRGALSANERAELSARRDEVVAHLRAAAAAEARFAPLSFSQQSLWFLHQQAPASTAYHVAFSARIASPLDPLALRSALQALVDRHPTLRTTYPLTDGSPSQRVAGAGPIGFEVHELPGAGDPELRAAVEAEYRRPFDLEHGPVIRASLFRRAPADQVLLLTVHHIAADGWSLMILVEELLKLHAEAAGGAAASLPRPTVEYADYARWQGEVLGGPEGERLWAYWRGKLTPPPGPLKLPGDHPRPRLRSFRGASQPILLAPEWMERTRELARQEGTTPFVVLLSCFQALLFRLTGERDVVVGTPTFARGKAEFLRVVGDFVNSVPLRGALDPAVSFRATVRQLRQVVLEALDAQEMPLSLLVQRLQLARDPSRSPLFESFFVLQRFDQFRELQDLMAGDGGQEAVELHGLCLAPFPLNQQEGQFDLALQMVERGGELRGVFKFNTELFEPATAARIAEGFVALVEAALGAPDRALGELPTPRVDAAWWRQELEGAPAVLELPGDRPRPPTPSHRGRRVSRAFAPSLPEAIRELARRHGTTRFTALLAGFQVLLHRWSGQEDVVVDTVLDGRDPPGARGVLGCLANPLPLHGRLRGNPTFAEFLAQLHRTTLGALEHRQLSLEALVAAAGLERSDCGAPICRTFFTLREGAGSRGVEGPPVVPVLEPPDVEAARFDLALEVEERDGALLALWKCAADLIDGETVERMHGQMERLLEAAAADPGCRVQALPLLGPEEERVLDEWNASGLEHDRGRCLHQLLEASARARPEAVAVVDGQGSLGYRALDERANRLAQLLVERGVVPGALVAVCLDRSADMLTAIAAVLKAGAAYVPLDPTHPAERLRYTLEDAGVACAVISSAFTLLLAEARAPLVVLDEVEAELARLPPTPPSVVVRPEDRAYVIYTSGSTGRPKGVEVEHRNVVAFLEAMRRRPGMSEKDALLAVTTLSFDIAGLELWLPLMVGARVVIAGRTDVLDGARLMALLDQHRVTVLQATPATWRLLLGAGWSGKGDLRALCGGEALPRDLAAALLGRVAQLWNMYGPTETTIWSTACRITDAVGPITVGRPIENTRVYVLEPSGLPAPVGVPGELCIGGEGVARGYHERPELTAEKFVSLSLPGGRTDRVYRTGDQARFLADGRIDFLGRRDEQVKIRGHRVELGEIEAVLAGQPGVDRCVVVVREDLPGDPRLVGYVVEEGAGRFAASEVRAALRATLPEYMVPGALIVLGALPLTPNGKTDRKALPAPEGLARPETVLVDDAHMTPLQRAVAAAWREVLHTDHVGLHDNFFDLGGHSLLLVKLHAALRAELGGDLQVVDLFQWTTVAAQAARLQIARRGPAAPAQAGPADSALRRAQARAARQLRG